MTFRAVPSLLNKGKYFDVIEKQFECDILLTTNTNKKENVNTTIFPTKSFQLDDYDLRQILFTNFDLFLGAFFDYHYCSSFSVRVGRFEDKFWDDGMSKSRRRLIK